VKYLRLVWAGIWRKPGRAILTILSIANAFVMFGLLQGLISGVNHAVADIQADVLMTQSRVSQIEPLPLSQEAKIARVTGVEAVSPMIFFLGSYQRPEQYVIAYAVRPEPFAEVFSKFGISRENIAALRSRRDGALAPTGQARKYNWKVGDRVPLRSATWLNVGSGRLWTVQIVGLVPPVPGGPSSIPMIVNYEYVDEGRSTARGTTNYFVLKVTDPSTAGRVSQDVDRLFANSPFETKTITQKQMAQDQFKQLGDINLVVNAVIGAVFFALLFSIGSTMWQSMRERVPELAILKTLGFSDRAVLLLLFSESLLLCLVSAAIGLGIAAALFPVVRSLIGFDAHSGPVMAWGFVFAILLAAISGLPPAVRAMRLQIVDALAGR
jgi:putative ABC transport system permease protein